MERTVGAPAPAPTAEWADGPGLGAELRESVLLLTVSVGLTALVTVAAQATAAFLA